MGRCSATEIFDPVVKFMLAYEISELAKVDIIRALINVLEDYDWDCQSDSRYYDDLLVHKIFCELHPDWFGVE